MKFICNFLCFIILLNTNLFCNTTYKSKEVFETQNEVLRKRPATPAANFIDDYLNKIMDKNVALVVNQTSTMYDGTHLVDTLKSLGVNITKIFAPEHGFRGEADAGAKIKNSVDTKTNIPIISLYGDKKKPTLSDFENIDIVVFDIQDVGVRFYTYISTLHYVMEACAENNKAMIVLDRPNPNGHYIDGPTLKDGFQSFVGMHKVPVVYGMTIGEYANMINGEKWLKNGENCKLEIIPCQGYTHKFNYTLPIKPSPNLPNMLAVYLYPSLCFFEGTEISVGRGTDKPFQIFGHPSLKNFNFKFEVKSLPGALHPPHENSTCYGVNLSEMNEYDLFKNGRLEIKYLIETYKSFKNKKAFFLSNNFIDKLSGSDVLRKQLLSGKNEQTIRASWQKDLNKFKIIRKKYLIYTDFD